METKKKIKPNKELYGDFIPTPIPLEPVQERIDFFARMVEYTLDDENYNSNTLNEYHKAWIFWREIKEKHCLVEVTD